MKNILFYLAATVAIAMVASSFKPVVAPRLYPELESFFKSVELKEKDLNRNHREALVNIRYNISISKTDVGDFNMVFYCSEYTFRSQASQVFAQTLCFLRKHKRVNVFSAGLKTGEIDSKLVDYLSKIGYRITKTAKDGKTAYEVRYSDAADPLVLFSKTLYDGSLPKNTDIPVILCDIKAEPECAALPQEAKPFMMAFPKVFTTDANDKAESTLKNIAGELAFATKM